MATLERSPVFSRALSINGVEVSQAVLDDLLSIRIEDGVEGQDIMTLDFDNPYQKYFDGHQFQRGMSVAFTGGMVGGRIEELFKGKMERPLASGGRDGEKLSIRCSSLDMLDTAVKSAYSDPLERVTVEDALIRIFAHIKLSVEWRAAAPHVQAARTIITSFMSRPGETAVQFAARLTRDYLGASVQVTRGRAIIRDAAQAVTASAAEWELEWRRNIDAYSVPERSEKRAPVEWKSTYVGPTTEAVARMHELVSDSDNFPDQETWNDAKADYERVVELREVLIKADAEARQKAVAARSGADEFDLELTISNLDNVVAGSWGRVLGLGPYAGVYHVADVRRAIRGDYEQRLKLDSRRTL